MENLPEEVMVYDVERHKAHCLSRAAASVWRHCNGERTAEDLSRQLRSEGIPADEEMVWMIVDRLGKLNLLQRRIAVPPGAILSSRREVMKKVGLAGGMLLLLTATISAPTVARAASGHHHHHHPPPVGK